MRDLAAALGLPVVIAASPRLGTINHTLLSIESARAAGLDVRAVVLTPWPETPGELERSNRETISRLGEIEVVGLGRRAESLRGRPRTSRRWSPVAALVPREFHPKRRLASKCGWFEDVADALLSEGSGVVPPEKGAAMSSALSILAIALLISTLVIDRLTR